MEKAHPYRNKAIAIAEAPATSEADAAATALVVRLAAESDQYARCLDYFQEQAGNERNADGLYVDDGSRAEVEQRMVQAMTKAALAEIAMAVVYQTPAEICDAIINADRSIQNRSTKHGLQ